MTFSINISSLPNQRQMRVWHLSGLKRMYYDVFYKHIVPTKSTPNQRYECHLGIPRMAFVGTEDRFKL